MIDDRHHNTDEPSPLGEADARGLDALVEAGFDIDRVDPTLRDDAARVAGLLGLLDAETTSQSHTTDRSRLTDRVVASIRDGYERESELTTPDSEALEAAVMAGFEPARVPGGLRERAARHAALADAVTTLGPDNEQWVSAGRSVRTDAVLRAVTSADAATIPFEQPRARRSFRIMDFVAAAAVLLLATAASMPVMSSMSESGHRRVCMSNLNAAGLGMGMYAMANNNAMPMATAGFGGSWSQVGVPGRSHSANLFTLVRTRHVKPWDLECPGNEHAPGMALDPDGQDWRSLEEVSYSYRLMPRGRNTLTVLDSDAVVLSDRSPVLISNRRGIAVRPEASSLNHGGEGQHLLLVDQSVRWTESPVLENGDNIWLPRVVEQIVHSVRERHGLVGGDELPTTPDDAFMGP